MGYDRGDKFSFDFEPNGIPFDSKSKGKLSPRSYPIQCERKWKHSFLSVGYCSTHHCINRAHGWMLTVQFHINIYLPADLLKLETYFWEVMSKTNY